MFASSVAAAAGFAATRGTFLDYLNVDLGKGGVQSDLSDLAPFTNMKIAGVPVALDRLPKGLKEHKDLGVVMPSWIDAHVIHRFPQPAPTSEKIHQPKGKDQEPAAYVDCPRPLMTPRRRLPVVGNRRQMALRLH